MREVLIPATGFAMTEALLLHWYKQPGDPVNIGEAIAEIETDKVTTDLESPATGVLGPHLAEEGTFVPVGVPLARILEETDAVVLSAAQEGPAQDTEQGQPAGTTNAPGPSSPTSGLEPARRAAPADAAADSGRGPHRLSPRQRRQARLTAEAETGSSAEAEPAPTAERLPEPAAESAARSLSGGSYRDAIAARVAESWRTIPHFAVTREVSAEAILSIRADRVRRADLVPSVTDLLLRALAEALRDSGREGAIDVGLAVATDRGVVIPVITDVLSLDLAGLASARQRAVDRARSGKLLASDLSDPPPTTLSNLGPFGVDQFTGVIALGQTSLLTVGRIARRVVPAGDGVVIRATFHATLNVDHRAFDGADAARLLMAFVNAAEDAIRLEREAFQ